MNDISIEMFAGPHLSQALVEEWSALCENGSITHPFCCPEFVLTQAEVEKRLNDLRILTVRIDNVLKGILPLKFHQKRLYGVIPVTMLESGGGEFTERFDVILASDSVKQTVIEALWSLLEKGRWNMMVFKDIVAGSALEDLIRKARVWKYNVRWQNMKEVPYRVLGAHEISGDSGINPVSKNMRQQIGRCERNLSKTGKLSLLSFEKNERELWEQLLQMEDAGWKGIAGSSILRSPGEKLFLEKVMETEANRKCFIWHVLKLDEKIIAMQVSFIWKKRYFLLKITYDENQSSYKPGQLLTNKVLRDIAGRGLIEYDFLGESEEWKLKWTDSVRKHLSWHVYRPGVFMWLLCGFQHVIVPHLRRFTNKAKHRTEPEKQQ